MISFKVPGLSLCGNVASSFQQLERRMQGNKNNKKKNNKFYV